MGYISDTEWARFRQTINNVHDDFNQKSIIWRSLSKGFQNHGEDTGDIFNDVTLQVLMGYNDYRKWPATVDTVTGALDRENCVVFINQEYLRNLGYLNADNNLKYRQEEDRFIIDGVIYKAMGETKSVPAKSSTPISNDGDLLVMIILARDKVETGEVKYK